MAKVNKTASGETPKLIEVHFIVSPTGKFGLAYSVGEKGFFNEPQAIELVDAGYAELVK